ncbi:MAG: hypothetical protein R3C42_02740 [Parvularculaceae bacterium]
MSAASSSGFEKRTGTETRDGRISLYAKNLFNFVSAFIDAETKELAIDWNDEIIKGVGLTRAGEIVHPNFAPAQDDPAPGEPAPIDQAPVDQADGAPGNSSPSGSME